MLDCDGSRVYVGVSTDVDRRLNEHRGDGGRGARFTRGCQRIELLYAVRVGGRGLAQRIEFRLKRLPAETKRDLARNGVGLHKLLDRLQLERPSTGDSRL